MRTSWADYVALQEVRSENARLREEVARLRVGLQQERALAQRARSLEEILELRANVELATVAATVIAGGASPDFRTITIDKGMADGLRPQHGRHCAGGRGRPDCHTNRASVEGAAADRPERGGRRAHRTVAGTRVVEGTGGGLRMNYVSGVADVQVGDTVVTSGIDGIYPKGFVIGQIESVERGSGGFGTIVVRPVVDSSSVEAVLVVVTPPAAAEEDDARSDAGQARE